MTTNSSIKVKAAGLAVSLIPVDLRFSIAFFMGH
jgi:hypothetical protein